MKKTLRAGGALLGLLFSLSALVGTAAAATDYAINPAEATVRSGESVDFTVTQKVNGSSVDVTAEADFSTTDPAGTVTAGAYFAGTVGTWTVTADIKGNAATAAITVTPGDIDRLLITPREDVVRVEDGKTLQFLATAYDGHNNIVPDADIDWSGVFSVGTISDTGLFMATTPGSSQVIAASGMAIDTVTIAVFTPAEPAPVANTNTDGTTNQETSNTNTEPEGIAATTDDPSEASAADCATLPWWGWLGVTIGFLVLVYAYHHLIRNQRSSLWLLGTALLTGGTLWLYFGIRCGNEFTWVTWVVAIGAAILTVLRPQTFQSNFGGDL